MTKEGILQSLKHPGAGLDPTAFWFGCRVVAQLGKDNPEGWCAVLLALAEKDLAYISGPLAEGYRARAERYLALAAECRSSGMDVAFPATNPDE